MHDFSTPFPDAPSLPFNRGALEQILRFESPDADPGGEGVWVWMRGTDLFLAEEEGELRLPSGPLPVVLEPLADRAVYLGTWQGLPCRALPLSRSTEPPEGVAAHNLLGAAPHLGIALLSLGGMAGQVLHWEKGSRHCSLCGGSMERLPGEWGKKCAGCGYLHFPHIHPCVIVLVRRPGQVLLARKAQWPEGRYGLVAGFVDFSECLEEAVAREVMEETGLRVKNVRYVGSQSWPFPSQLMAGFVADYDGGEIVVDRVELEDARWFAVDELPELPPRRSIARFILDAHLRD